MIPIRQTSGAVVAGSPRGHTCGVGPLGKVGATLCATACLLASRFANAASGEQSVGLVVASAPGCIDRDRLAAAVDGVLEREAIGPSPAHATIHATIGPGDDPETWQATLSLEVDYKLIGTREVIRTGPSCAVLDGPLAVVTALLVDVAKDSIRVVVPPVAPAEVAPAPPKAEPIARTQPTRSPWEIRTEAAVTLLAGLIPVAPGVRVETRVAPPHFVPLLLRFDAWPFATTREPVSGGVADFHATTLSVGLCPELRGDWLAASLCVSGMFGALHVTGRDVPVPGGTTSFIALVEAEVGVAVRLAGRVWLHAAFGLAGGYRPADWHFDSANGPTVVFRPWEIAIDASLGVVFELGRSENPPPGRHP